MCEGVVGNRKSDWDPDVTEKKLATLILSKLASAGLGSTVSIVAALEELHTFGKLLGLLQLLHVFPQAAQNFFLSSGELP